MLVLGGKSMTREDKNAYIQLEKALETYYKVNAKMDLIDQNYESMFKTHDDYQSLKQSYKIEEKYATLKCKDLISNNQSLSKDRKSYDSFKKFHKSKSLIFEVSIVFSLLFIAGLSYSILQSSSMIWFFASLSLMSLGILGCLYFSKNSDASEYLGPSSMQIKVLKRIDSLILSGQLYEEVIKDCQLQFAKRKLIQKAKNKSLNFDLTETNTYPRYIENFIYAYSGLINIKNVTTLNEQKVSSKKEVVSSSSPKVKASNSPTYLKYLGEKSLSSKLKSKKTVVARYEGDSTITRVSLDIENSKKSRKKASDSSIYLKYLEEKNQSSKSSSKSTSEKPIIARYEGNSTITKASIDIQNPKKIRKKVSDSSIYQKYLSQKVASK